MAKVPKAVEAMPENVADAVPLVTSDNMSAPRPFRALKTPTVANRINPIVARPILPIKPSDTMLVVESVPFISAKLTPAARTQPTTLLHILAHLRFLINSISLQPAVSNGAS